MIDIKYRYDCRRQTQFNASGRGKKVLKSSRDKKEGVYRCGEGGEESMLGDPGSELRLGRKRKENNAKIRH